jgi:hypothetical protein
MLFHDVIKVLDLMKLGEAPQSLVTLQVGHCLGIGGVFGDRDGPQIDRVRASKCFAK